MSFSLAHNRSVDVLHAYFNRASGTMALCELATAEKIEVAGLFLHDHRVILRALSSERFWPVTRTGLSPTGNGTIQPARSGVDFRKKNLPCTNRKARDDYGLLGRSGLDEAFQTIEPVHVEFPPCRMTVTADSEEMERQLFAQMDKPRLSKAMDKYFFATPSKYEAKMPKPTRRLWTEGAVKEFLAEAIRDVTGDRRLVASDNSSSYIELASDSKDKEKTRHASILSHAAVTASPDLQLVWAQSQDPTPTESTPPTSRRAYSAISVTIEVKESSTMSAEAEKRVIRRLHMIRGTALYARHAIGITLCGDVLQVYLVNASGAFTTNAHKCDEEAVLLRRVLSRLIELDDDDDDGLGMLVSLNEADDILGTFVVSGTLLPPRAAHDFESDLGLEIQHLLVKRRYCRGLTTSAFHATTARPAPQVDPTSISPITSTSPTPAVEYAMTLAWAEQSFLDDGIALRRKMHAASRADTEGLSLSAGIYRGEFRTLPTFLGDDESFDGIEPCALEVVFTEQCYWPLNMTTTTKELAQAALGVVKGLRNLYKLGYIHRDISNDSVVIDRDGVGALIDYHHAVPHDRPCTERCRRIRSGTWPYLPCSILAQPQQPLPVVHERWHDIESLFYAVMEISFREPYMGDDEVLVMTPEGEIIWFDWNRQEADLVYMFKEMLRLNTRYHKLLKGCAQRWTNIKQLVDILRSNCGLDSRFIDVEVVMEEHQLGELWGPSGTMSYEAIISEIERLLPLL